MWRWLGVCVFAAQIISRTVKGADGLSLHFIVHFSVRLIHDPCLQHGEGEERSCNWNRAEEFIVGTRAGCVVCRIVKRRTREDAADPVFFNSIRPVHTDLLPPSHVECTSEILSSWPDMGASLDVLAVKQQ